LLIRIFLLIILILINAFFAASEIALVSLNDKLVKKQAEDGDIRAKKLYAFLSQPGRFLATIQIGITFAGFLASAIAAESFSDELVKLVTKTGIPVSAGIMKSISVILITFVLSYFTLVFGELLPKNVAMQYSEKIANSAVGPLSVLSKITNPFVNLLTSSTNFFIKIFGGNPSRADRENVTEEEIRMMVDVGEESGVIQNSEKEMIDNIFRFDDISVSEIMTHRINVAGIPINSGFKEVLEIMNRDKYTRVPVYQTTIDNIIGILHVKDLLQFMDCDQVDFNLSK
jgi:putative hemolysin